MPGPPDKHDFGVDEQFVNSLEPILARVQTELRLLTVQIPAVRTPTDLQNALGINYNTSWKVMRVVGASMPLEAGPFVPAHVSLKNLLAASVKAKLSVDASDLLDASDAFHAFVEEHAGDRNTFDTIISSLTGVDSERVSTELKRNAFRLNRQIFGRSLDVALGANIVRPGKEPGCVDVLAIHNVGGLVRLRPNASLRIGTRRLRDKGTDILGGREAVDPDALAAHGAPFLLECMDGPPPLLEIPGRDGSTETHLSTPSIGLNAKVSCILADVRRDSPIATVDDVPVFHYRIAVRSPCETIIQDLLIHESLFPSGQPDFTVLTDHPGTPEWPSPDSPEHLPIQEQVLELGRPPDSLHATGVPRYRDILARSFERLAWTDLDRYRLFRVEVQYPVLNSVLWQRVHLTLPRG